MFPIVSYLELIPLTHTGQFAVIQNLEFSNRDSTPQNGLINLNIYENIDVALSKTQMMMCWRKVCKPQVGIKPTASPLCIECSTV